MEIIKDLNSENIDKIVCSIKKGGIIICPTETVYGISCNPFDKKAVETVNFLKKGRSKEKRFLMLSPDIETVEEKFEFTDKARELAEKYWPGALSVVLKLRNDVCLHELIMGSDRYVGVRLSPLPIIKNIMNKWNELLLSTSANITGEPVCRDVSQVLDAFRENLNLIDYIIDGGVLDGMPSTVVRVADNRVELLRQGAVKIEI